MATTNPRIMALDVGTVRIGAATALTSIRIASPLLTIPHDEHVFSTIQGLIDEQDATQLVVGLPRNLNGDDTAQTQMVREFTDALAAHVKVPIVLQDEALTSRKAEAELTARGKQYEKGDIDALAATYILEDYLTEQEHA